VLLLSGGMDSASLAFWHKPKHALSVDYGQASADAEMRASAKIASELQINHHIIKLDLRQLGLGRMALQRPPSDAPTPEWWPFRNQLLITLAAAKAVILGADAVVIGTLRTDGLHADGRKDFIDTMRQLLAQQEREVKLLAPALELDATELAQKAGTPLSLLGWTHSCHVANFACGRCRGCQKHADTLSGLGFDRPSST
jgi:7-cyano-7-deazaguanine synthase